MNRASGIWQFQRGTYTRVTVRDGWPPFDVWQRRRQIRRAVRHMTVSTGVLVLGMSHMREAVALAAERTEGLVKALAIAPEEAT